MKNFRLPYFSVIFLLVLLASCSTSEKTQKSTENTLRIPLEVAPSTLDPRRVRDLATVTTIQMLYEGLMRTQQGGELLPALAESVTISSDKKRYTFHLRPSAWANGDSVTAVDFEQTWKSSLAPNFPSPNAYQLYVIKGAQAAKDGDAPIEEVAVRALDPLTLEVELEQPTPQFLSLTTTHPFYPVHRLLWIQPPESSPPSDSMIITNGPFKPDEWNHLKGEMSAVPNPHYWDVDNIHLKRIQLLVLDNPVALQLFLSGELDWAGSPLGTLPVDSLASLKKQGKLEVVPSAGVYFIRVNTEKPPFNDPKVRKAFALALNRGELVEHVLQGNQVAALEFVPPSILPSNGFFVDGDVQKGQNLLQEALQSQSSFPLTLNYAAGERPHKIAQVIQQQWKEGVGVDAKLQSNEPKVNYDLLKAHNYQMAIGSWFADYRDPLAFLEVFKQKGNGTNNTQWENERFSALLDSSSFAETEEERQKIFEEAQQILMDEMPIIPLFFNAFNYVKTPFIKGVYVSELGYLDFKQAYFKEEE